ncbi:hypothetical protein HAT94_02200 [Dickeya solani]|nr:hypothetical protein [Dickeya solani]
MFVWRIVRRMAFAAQFFPDLAFLTAPQPLDIIVMPHQDQAGEHGDRKGELGLNHQT